MIYQLVALLGFVLLQGSFGYIAVLSPSPTPSPWFECPADEGVFPSPRNCSEFFLCTNGLPWEQFCAAGLYFNPATGQCDWPANVDCRVAEAPSAKKNPQPKFHSLQKLPGYQGTDLGIDVNYTCPEAFGIYPHHECRKYYDCQNGKAHLILCWYDYYFDLTYNGCNYPNMVDCTGRDLPDDVSTTSAAPTTTTQFPFTCPSDDGFFPVPGECSDRYIICVDNIAYIEHCPANSLFNPANNLCEDPANVHCIPDTTQAPETTTGAITSVTEPPSTTQSSHFTCPSMDGLYPSPTNCGDYYVCQAGTAIINHCPQGLYFNPLTQLCDWPEAVDCNVKSVKAKKLARIPARVQAEDQGTDLGIDTNYTCPAAWGVFPHPQCREYYDCRAGDAHVMLCPNDWLFDLTYNGCNYPVYTDCGDRVKPGDETTTQKLTAAPGFQCPETSGFYGSGTCSSQYYVCVDGNAYPEVCPENTIFDDTTHRCDNWENVGGCLTSGSPNTTTTSTTTKKPTTAQSSGFSCPSSSGMFADPNSCNGYYVCQSGSETHMECAPGLYFNPAGFCDWPSNVPCSEKLHARMVKIVKVNKQRVQEEPSTPETPTEIQPTAQPDTTEQNSVSTSPSGSTGTTNITPAWWFECPGSGNYPDPEDCAAYFTCVNGLAWLEKCPKGTVYDPQSGTCLVSHDTNCVPTTNYPHTSPTKAPNVTADPSYKCPAPNGMFPNPLDCGTFYWCVDGAIFFMQCPASTEFNADMQQCVDPSESNCVITEMQKPTQATVFQNRKVNRPILAQRLTQVNRKRLQQRGVA